MIIGYVRISTKKQNIERQIRNIKAVYSDATIVQEIYTGTKLDGRKEFEKLIKNVKADDTIVFDSVSRFARNAEEGFNIYKMLYNRGVNLVFLKEPHINTDTYKKAMQNQISMTDSAVDEILKGVNKYLMILAEEQIKLAFEQAEKEVEDLRQRTKEGLQTAKLNGKKVGRNQGDTFTTKKAIAAKEIIKKHNKTFGGSLTNEETWQLAGITKPTFYKYKAELLAE